MTHVLHGPADASHYRTAVGRYGDRWYVDPLAGDDRWPATEEAWPSISTIKKAAGKDWSFVSLKRAADGIAEHPFGGGETPEEVYERLKGFNTRGLNRAADRGSIVHFWCDQLLKGHEPTTDVLELAMVIGGVASGALEDAMLYLPAVTAFFDQHQPTLVASEFPVFHRHLNGHGYGGTPDAQVIVDGQRWAIDWKTRTPTSDHGAYPEEAAQIAAAIRAEYAVVEIDGEPRRVEVPRVDGGLIVSIKPTGCRVYGTDIDRAWHHWEAMHAWWVARLDERKTIGRPWAPKAAAVEQPPSGRAGAPAATAGGDGLPLPSPPANSSASGAAPPPAASDADLRSFGRRHEVDEGGPADPHAMTVLGKRFAELKDDDRRARIATWTRAARLAELDFRPSTGHTKRRFELGRAVMMLAGFDDEDLVRHLVAAVIGEELEESIPTGCYLGTLDARGAAVLYNLAFDVAAGTKAITFTDAGEPAVA